MQNIYFSLTCNERKFNGGFQQLLDYYGNFMYRGIPSFSSSLYQNAERSIKRKLGREIPQINIPFIHAFFV